jgi:hypothetical protein
MDSHEDLIREFKLSDDGRDQKFVRFEITPKNGSYLSPDEWVYRLDQDPAPEWYKAKYAEKMSRRGHDDWLGKLRKILPEREIINPFNLAPPKKITEEQVDLVKKWASVGDSVRDSVWASVGDSVGASVGDSVWDSVWASVGDSVGASVGALVWASVRAYSGSLFILPRKDWKYTSKIKATGYPFQPSVDLWKMGLVPSFDGKLWRLHGGKDAKVLWEGKIMESVK